MTDELQRLIEIVARLRSPEGCPWDRKQTHRSLLSHLLDEAYEFFDAVDENDKNKIKEELGDLLLQVILHAQIGADEKKFTISDVARELNEKLIRRHPHVFGTTQVSSVSDVKDNWEKIKQGEPGKKHRKYLVDDIPHALPALFRKRAGSDGWPDQPGDRAFLPGDVPVFALPGEVDPPLGPLPAGVTDRGWLRGVPLAERLHLPGVGLSTGFAARWCILGHPGRQYGQFANGLGTSG